MTDDNSSNFTDDNDIPAHSHRFWTEQELAFDERILKGFVLDCT